MIAESGREIWSSKKILHGDDILYLEYDMKEDRLGRHQTRILVSDMLVVE